MSELHFSLLQYYVVTHKKSQLTTNDAKEGDFREKEEKITFWGGWKRREGEKIFLGHEISLFSPPTDGLVGQLGFGRKKDFLFWLCRLR